MALVNELPVIEMNNVDWDKLTESQAAGFGVSLGFFNDAHEECLRVRTEFFSRLAALSSCVFVTAVLLVWSASVQAALFAVMITLIVGTVTTAWRYRRSYKHLSTATSELRAELRGLQAPS